MKTNFTRSKNRRFSLLSCFSFLLMAFFFLLLLNNEALAQTPGFILQKALSPGPTVLDPNGDGYVSKSATGFPAANGTTVSGYNPDMGTNSEIPYRFFPQMPSPNGPEPLADLTTGSNGGHTDLANVPLAMYYVSSTQSVLFRVRLGGNSTASKGYSFLLDTDGVFNKLKLANGTLIDYATPSKVINLGFEFEVVLALNFDVNIYRHRGSGDQSDPMSSNIIWRGSANGGYNRYFQKSVAATRAGGDADYFFDFYVPLSAFSADGGPGINPDTPMRMSGSTVTSAQTGLEGTISDIGGVDDKKFANDKIRIWKEIVPKFPPTSLNQLENGDFCQSLAPSAPVINTNTPIRTTTTTITGTSTENGGTVKLYRNGVEINSASPVIVSNGSWSFNLPTGTSLIAGDKITTKVVLAANGSCPELISVSSNTVSVGTVQVGTCTTSTPPIVSSKTNKDAVNGTTIYPGATIRIYKDGVFFGTTTSSTTLTGNTYSWTYNNTTYARDLAYPRNGTGATSKDYATINASVTPVNSCESGRSNSLYVNTDTGTPATTGSAQTTQTPTIATSFICTSTSTISGTSEPGALIFLYVNGVPVKKLADGGIGTANADVNNATINFITPDAIAAGAPLNSTTDITNNAAWSVDLSLYGLTGGEKISFRAIVPNNSIGSGSRSNYPSGFEGLSAPTTEITVGTNCTTATPTIPTTKNSVPVIYCPTSTTISGTSTEANGTLVTVYRRDSTDPDNPAPNPATDTRITDAATVTNGDWSALVLGSANLQGGNVLYAVAQATGGKLPSAASATVTVSTPATAAILGLKLTSPIQQGATTISGTSTTNGTVFVYIDGIKIGGTATVTGATSTTPVPWTINITPANQLNLATGVPVTASITTGTGCGESGQTAAVLVSCNPPSTNPTISPLSQIVCSGNTALISVANSEDGVIYQIYNGTSASGASVLGNGGTIVLRSAILTGVGTTVNLKVRAYRSDGSCEITLNGSSSVTISEGLTNYTVSSLAAAACTNSTATINLSGSQTGVNYQLQILNKSTYPYTYVNSGTAIAGTGNALSFTTPALSTTSTFKIVANNGNCSIDMGDPVDINVTPVRTNLAVTPTSQTICGTANTVNVKVLGSQVGVQYQIFNVITGAISGTAVTGTGGEITLTSAPLTGTVGSTINFGIQATPVSPADCSPTSLTQTFTVTVAGGAPLATPTVSVVSPICSGSVATVTVGNTESGVSYQVQLISGTNYINVGSAVPGNGSTITLTTNALTSGTYNLRVLATNSCSSTPLTQTASLTVNNRPTANNLSPVTQTVCPNTSASIILSNSEAGNTYQLQRLVNGSYVNVTGTGTSFTPTATGNALTFTTPALSTNSYFKVVATNGSCTTDMGEPVYVSVLPATITATPVTKLVCANQTASVTLFSSQSGVSYQIFNGTTASGAAVTGTGGDITLTTAALTASGSFTIRATTAAGCIQNYTNAFSITVPATAPSASLTVSTTTTTVCVGNTAAITVAASQQDIIYQLQLESGTSPNFTYANQGTPVTGNGSTITLNTYALAAGTYTFRVIASDGCNSTALTQKVVVTVNPEINVSLAVSPATQTVCSGSTASVSVSSPQIGVTYSLYNITTNAYSGNAVRVTENTTSITLTTGTLNTTGTNNLKVVVTNGCSRSELTQVVAVTASTPPATFALTSPSSQIICSGSSATISLAGSESGVTYRLYNGNTPIGDPILGNGSEIFLSTGSIPSGTYTLKVTGSKECGPIDIGTTTITADNSCGLTYTVQPPYMKDSYVTNEIIATPELSGWNYTGPLTYEILEGEPLSGTSLDLKSGQIYVSNTTTLLSGTRNLRILAKDNTGTTRTSYMTYSVNDATNGEGNTRTAPVTVLPVTLVYFKASVFNSGSGQVKLTWATASEENNEYFNVERSFDGTKFNTVAKIKGAGTSKVLLKYDYIDQVNTNNSNLYYRLKQVDFSGKIEYSKVIAVKPSSKIIEEYLITYPNPAKDKVTIKFLNVDQDMVQIELRDLAGKVVLQQTNSLKENLEVSVNTESLPNGIYLVVAKFADNQVVTRLIVEK
ncbi:T9SS type A sorting domain-containing protein [Adhaeribacter aquaticus]|uniref:T9SS type A sorting domain-containing protein n=1 Tax=Adhaeribacter aquaticus TaxID=299567 RepID=UPI000408D4C5|nr:T9SS type A sorting domain-containing protein [Adhaeribacter aquaticus]